MIKQVEAKLKAKIRYHGMCCPAKLWNYLWDCVHFPVNVVIIPIFNQINTELYENQRSQKGNFK